jgi:hypothetical protein
VKLQSNYVYEAKTEKRSIFCAVPKVFCNSKHFILKIN